MAAVQYEVADYETAIEMFHRKGWTDGLPIVPPTPARVAQFLEAAGLKGNDQIGLYQERRLPIIAEKLAINAVMAGCLPEYFPVVVSIVDAMLEPGFPLHVANSSTGSFTLGFIVNGPIRKVLGMNCHGNMLGPGNRANSSIGRAIRLIQLNVMGSIPGAGAPAPAHGRAVLDRSMMGQPAKYAGYHIIENEEEFPSLMPVHVELGFDASVSTVTVFLLAGDHWTDCHAEQTPQAWIDTMAQYIVGTGQLHASSYGIVLLPPENARLFVNAGWTKADIRRALYERTRRSLAWVKSSGYKVRFHRERCEPVQPGDESSYLAMAASPAPEDLFVVVCGGVAGSWPYYLYGLGGPIKAVTRKINRESPRAGSPTPPSSAVVNALAPLRSMLAADGYDLELREERAGILLAEIKAGPQACAGCLVPETMMRGYFEQALRSSQITEPLEIRLIYPTDFTGTR
jgi:hypothetical protein